MIVDGVCMYDELLAGNLLLVMNMNLLSFIIFLALEILFLLRVSVLATMAVDKHLLRIP